jgi:hypothetical protein
MTIRAASLLFAFVFGFAPLPAHAQPISVLRAEVRALRAALAAETAARQAADTTLQNNINAEASARAAADTTLQNNINNEAAARAAAGTALDTRVSKLEGNITPADLVGTYTFAGILTRLRALIPDNPPRNATIGSTALTGTLILNANGSGSLTETEDGSELTQGPWTLTPSSFNGTGTFTFTWTYASGTIAVSFDMGGGVNVGVGPGGRLLIASNTEFHAGPMRTDTHLYMFYRLQ